jgi:hypothetical protein
MASEKATMKSPSDAAAATVVEEVSKPSSEAVDVLDIDARIQQMARECPPFYRNRNLFILYLRIAASCLVAAITLGYDGAMLNGLQAVEPFDECM